MHSTHAINTLDSLIQHLPYTPPRFWGFDNSPPSDFITNASIEYLDFISGKKVGLLRINLKRARLFLLSLLLMGGRYGVKKTNLTGGHLSLSKIIQPVVSGTFPREGLFRYHYSNRNLPVTFIMSPPRSDETSLISNYLSDRNILCLWYSIGEGDIDISTFFYYVGLALRKAFPGKKKPLPRYTPDYAHGVLVFVRRLFKRERKRCIIELIQ